MTLKNLLSDWYLARLRKLAWHGSLEEKPTPMTLVKTDKNLVQQLVAQASQSQDFRREQFLERLSESHEADSNQILIVSCIGVLILLLFAFL